MGSINAAEALKVIGSIKYNGLILSEIESATHNGNKACTTVTFATSWVINKAMKQAASIIIII